MKKQSLFLLLFACTNVLFSQNQETFWQVGDITIEFKENGSVVFSQNDTIEAIDISSEGNCSYSDSNGVLTMYSDGLKVWDRTHHIMENGNNLGFGTGTNGITSSLQASIVIPMPEDYTKYFLFSNNGMPTAGSEGIYYSIVDMSLPGNGTALNPAGKVVSKRISLLPETDEAMTGAIHCNGKDYWLLTSKGGSFYSFLITNAGVNSIPIITTYASLGINPTGVYTIRINQKGNKILFSQFNNQTNTSTIFLCDFDNNIGKLTKASSFLVDGIVSGVNFSPNGNLLYCCIDDGTIGSIAQFDLRVPDIETTITLVTDTNTFGSYGLGSIDIQNNYKTGKTIIMGLGVSMKYFFEIPNPNVIGKNCGFNKLFENELFDNFSSEYPNWSVLPNVILYQSPTQVSPEFSLVASDTSLCNGNVFLDVSENDGTYLWSNGSTSSQIEVSLVGEYSVIVKGNNACKSISDTLVSKVSECFSNDIHIPNIITPNSDGYNDIFSVGGLESEAVLQIYDRWGDKIYENTNYDNNWNGHSSSGDKLAAGVYYYVLKVGKKNYSGFLTLI